MKGWKERKERTVNRIKGRKEGFESGTYFTQMYKNPFSRYMETF